jgi:hypothetical protein
MQQFQRHHQQTAGGELIAGLGQYRPVEIRLGEQLVKRLDLPASRHP